MRPKDSVRIICPGCRQPIGTGMSTNELCANCGTVFARLHGIPLLRSFSVDEKIDYSKDNIGLPAHDSSSLPIPFVIEAFSSGGLVLELGAGADICSSENLVKTDAYLYSENLDYVTDGHCLPFSDNTFDYVFSFAVFEHLHSPWIVAEEIFRVLKPGGKVYTLSAFNQHVHGYPSHFFNMTDMGLRRVFYQFEIIECQPSRFCPLDQIAYSLLDLKEMVEHLNKQKQKKLENTLKVDALETALLDVIQLIPVLQDELIELPEAYEAWRKIAPGFELIGRKQKSENLVSQLA